MARLDATIVGLNEAELYKNGIANLDEKLPISQHRQAILDAIESNTVVLVHGATGSGKTTQIPQYILDAGIRKGDLPCIIVTQPRRIAAISIARHICHERKWELGGLVGYRIAQDSAASQQTRILYCTQGVFLEMLKDRSGLSRITHVILDEMHEREEEMDLALLLMKKLVLDVVSPPSIKLIVMSATMDMEKFSTYLKNPPVIAIHTGMYKVEEYYLGDIGHEDVTGFSLDLPCVLPPVQAAVVDLVDSFDEYERDSSEIAKGVVLLFVSGLRDIQDFTKAFVEKAMLNGKQWNVLPLHSTISRQDQDRVFAELPPDTRRIIISTNIAESSVTIPNVKYVIDLCLTKQMMRDEFSSFTSLRQAWASKSSCDQRRGRAGRLSAGLVFRMVPRAFYEQLPSHTIPEMLRIPLHRTILRVKVLDIPGQIQEVMADALDPPNAQAVERSVLELMEAGALDIPTRWSPSKNLDGHLTSMGRIMSSLPLDISLSRLVILSVAFGCVEQGIMLAACLASRSFWDVNFGNDRDKYRMKMVWDRGQHSDLLATLNAFQAWERAKVCSFKGKVAAEREWCKQYLINYFRINETKFLYDDLCERVERLGLFLPFGAQQKSVGGWDLRSVEGKADIDAVLLLQLVIAGAFYPNYFLQDTRNNYQQLPDVSEDKGSLILTVTPNRPVYTLGVKNWFGRCGLPIPSVVDVDEGDGQITVSFEKDDYFTQSDIPLAVYLCLKLGSFKDSYAGVRKVIEPPTPKITSVLQFQPRQVQLSQTRAPRAEFRPVEFNGPFSLFQLEPSKFRGVTPDVQYRCIKLSNLSVNSVLINTAEDPSLSRLLVSSAVSAAEGGDHLYLEDSTLMPALPGFNDLIILLFAPQVSFSMDDAKKVVGYLAGLGSSKPQSPKEPDRSFWKDHDIKRSLQVSFSDRHIAAIQLMRDAIKLCFQEDMIASDSWRHTVIPKVQDFLRDALQEWLLEEFLAEIPEPLSRSRFQHRSSAT